ncbi:hypothetical protein ZEAMMB73_Zm00001d006122 [Zea mays]|uniref:Uncharacterized protein n=1 Tax=Zea mays TaxID=4577 RepID=A0A1D6ET19_MAIZE|nr:hypothetical protein ZEAMMB73_Zm00001d006122 [Zea mays]
MELALALRFFSCSSPPDLHAGVSSMALWAPAASPWWSSSLLHFCSPKLHFPVPATFYGRQPSSQGRPPMAFVSAPSPSSPPSPSPRAPCLRAGRPYPLLSPLFAAPASSSCLVMCGGKEDSRVCLERKALSRLPPGV